MCPVNAEVRVPFRAVQWDLEPVYDFSALGRITDVGFRWRVPGFRLLAPGEPSTTDLSHIQGTQEMFRRSADMHSQVKRKSQEIAIKSQMKKTKFKKSGQTTSRTQCLLWKEHCRTRQLHRASRSV